MTANIGVLQIIDTLEVGGAERVAVNLANHLPRSLYRSHLCSTRRDGVYKELIAADVQHLSLKRRYRFDIGALRRLVEYIQANNIKILHAHGTSLFIAAFTSLFSTTSSVVWHDHFGRFFVEERPVWLYRMATRNIYGVIAVNQSLADWARYKLRIPNECVWYIPNYVCLTRSGGSVPPLPGQAGARIVCVASLRPEKGHLRLIEAMKIVTSQISRAHLLIVGSTDDKIHLTRIEKEIKQQGLDEHISLLGQRHDVPAILKACDIGVLSSLSEGLPLALLEYGAAGLPVVCTDVGQCHEVLDEGRAGLLVPPSDPQALASALMSLIQSPNQRAEFGKKFIARVEQKYSMQSTINQVSMVYKQIVSEF